MVFALGVEGGAQEIGHRHAGNFDRHLERHEQTFVGAVFGRQGQQVFAVKGYGTFRDAVFGVADKHIAQRRLARAIRTHKHVDFAVANGQVDAFQDFFALNRGV